LQALVPQIRSVFEILALQVLQLFRREFQAWRGGIRRWFQTAQVNGLKMLHGLTPAFAQVLLKPIGHLGPKIWRGRAHRLSPESIVFFKSLVPSIFQFVVT
jgi:hypothetical protein